ncbi:MAG: four helix bundle protein [Bacteroidota bacterium]|nr:four helix bundle protein [Bacteroidota bacterium]
MAGFRDMIVYQKSFALAVQIFKLTKRFPKEELFGLTSQVRNSSRSTCANFGEAYRRRRYKAHLVSKLTDSDSENTETQVHLDMAVACEYATSEEVRPLIALSEEVGLMLNSLIENPEKLLLKPKPGK